MLLLLQGQTGEAWEPSTKQDSFGNQEAMDRKLLSLLHVFKCLKNYKHKLYGKQNQEWRQQVADMENKNSTRNNFTYMGW
jgi:hypothetical protein